ncbi:MULTISPECIES: PASTA domain-containing protein [unclassified Streptomyces]|uniref:PASTA domain-containing protein n=1 Tax=unclassified Streptomyces TaxID=2593676 RepID=UPI0035E1EC1B
MASLLIVTSLVTAGCGSSQDSQSGAGIAFRDVRPGTPLLEVVDEVTAAGLGLSLRDATFLNRYIPPELTREYTVCFTEDKPDYGAVDLFVVPSAEACPAEKGAVVPRPPVPDVTGRTSAEAAALMASTGFSPDRMTAQDQRDPSGRLDSATARNWRVCSQSPAAGKPFRADEKVLMRISAKCRTAPKSPSE